MYGILTTFRSALCSLLDHPDFGTWMGSGETVMLKKLAFGLNISKKRILNGAIAQSRDSGTALDRPSHICAAA